MDGELTGVSERVLLESLLESPSLGSFLGSLTQLSALMLSERVGDPVSCSVTMRRAARGYTIAPSDEMAAAMDEIQYASGEGPCLHALNTESAVRTYDLQADARWPLYAARMTGHDVRAVLAEPIPLRGSAAAALNCYSSRAGAFDDPGLRAEVASMAEMASTSLMLAVRIGTEADQAADLRAAMESRTRINLATGIIMAQTGCGQEQALNILRDASSNRNRKLRDVAADILSRYGEGDAATHFTPAGTQEPPKGRSDGR